MCVVCVQFFFAAGPVDPVSDGAKKKSMECDRVICFCYSLHGSAQAPIYFFLTRTIFLNKVHAIEFCQRWRIDIIISE